MLTMIRILKTFSLAMQIDRTTSPKYSRPERGRGHDRTRAIDQEVLREISMCELEDADERELDLKRFA